MKKRFHLIHGIPLSLSLFSLLLYFFIVSLFAGPVHANSDDLAAGFDNPPHAARPHAYWAWMNGYVSIPQLTKELENMKEKGLAGLEIFDIAAKDPENIVPAGPAFMGAESVQAIAHAVREAGRLGMEIGLITSSSWNAGGPWVTPKHGTQGIFHSQAVIEGSGQITLTLPVPKIPQRAPKNDNGLPAFYKDVAVLAIPFSEAKQIDDLSQIIDISDRMDPSGQLNWKAPKGKWTLMRFICACTGETLVLPSPKSDGLIIDHFSAEATTMHFQYLIEQLKTELGDLSETALRYLYLPSYEVTSYDKEKGMVWTPALVEEFTQRRGYDPTTYLPLLFGYTSAQEETANRFHYDFRMTLSDLIIENHYQTAREVCHEHGLLLCSEAGGPGQPLHNCPFEALRALGSLDVPRGEFWYKHQRFDEEGIDILWLVKEIACAAHIYNKTVVDGEAFTSFHHWQLSPFDLKPLADRAFCGGQNHFTFHTGPHCPPEAGQPGWVYHAGTHMNVNRVWWPMAKPFIDYLARGSFLLQQGHFVGDVCFYYGDDAPNFVKPKHIHPTIGYGFDYDVVNTEVILERMRVENGKLTLPGGLQYEMLVLPDREDMDVNVLKKLTMLVQKGATVVGPRPTRSNGLHNYEQRDAEIDRLARRLWGSCDGIEQKEHRFGEGYIMQGRPLRAILTARGIGPDFWVEGEELQQQIDYIHQRDGQADMYFVNNASAQPVEAECTFRVFDRAPEIWRPDTGERYSLAIYKKTKKGIQIPLSFQPHDAFFVVFRRPIQPDGTVSAQDKMPYKAARENGRLALYFKDEGDFAFQKNNKTLPIKVSGIPQPLPLEGAWELRFPSGWGAPERTTIQNLQSWTEMENEGIQYFSGIAEYHKDFTLPSAFLKEGIQIHLNLGQVKEMAEIILNGKRVGIVWKPPYAIDITNAAKKGNNRLTIKVANTWNNRLVGDAKNPDQKFTQTNIQYSEMWKVPWEKTPLKESGLMGPVKLETVKRVVVKFK